MMSLTFGLFTQVSGSWPLGPLVCSFETVFMSVSDRLPKREKEKKKDRREKKCQNNLHPHLLQAH